MTIRCDPPRRLGPVTLRVIVRQSVGGHPAGRGLALWGRKQPLAIVIEQPGGWSAWDMQGRPLSRAHIAALCPEALPQEIPPPPAPR